jgi:hypothetical protein
MDHDYAIPYKESLRSLSVATQFIEQEAKWRL